MLKVKKDKILNTKVEEKQKNVIVEKAQKILKENRQQRLKMWKNY